MSTSIQIRTYRATDLPTLVRLSNAERAGRGEPAAQTEERLQRHFDNFIFGFQPERDVFLALNGDEACGYAWTALNGEYSTGYISTTIDPAHGTSPTLERLQAVAEAHIRTTLGGDQLPPERPFFIDTFVSHDSDTEKMRCLAALGYNEVRRFYDMLIQLEGELQPATIPPAWSCAPFSAKLKRAPTTPPTSNASATIGATSASKNSSVLINSSMIQNLTRRSGSPPGMAKRLLA